MKQPRQATLLRIFMDETARGDEQPLFKEIVRKAQDAHLAGATVLRGPLGFGRSGVLHTEKILRLSYDLPVVIEIIDSDENIQKFLPQLASFDDCVITLAEVQAVRLDGGDTSTTSTRYSAGPPSGRAGD